MKERKSAKVEFAKNETGHLKGTYYVKAVLPDGTDVLELFTDRDMQELTRFAGMTGFAGHIPLHNWLKANAPRFFRTAVTDGDPYGVVVGLLEQLQEFLGLTS